MSAVPALPPAPALLGVAHGSHDPRASATVLALLDAVRRARPGPAVGAAFLENAEPSVEQALGDLAAAGAGDVVVLPLLLTAAYHSGVDLPGQLREVAATRPGLRLVPGGVLGPHPLLVRALERRLREAGLPAGGPGTAVVLAAAGSSSPSAVRTVREVAEGWRRSAGWWDVRGAFAAAAPPTVAEAVAELRASGAPRVVVASYFLAPGSLPDRVAEQAGNAPVSAPLADAAELVELVLERYDAAVASALGPPAPAPPEFLSLAQEQT